MPVQNFAQSVVDVNPANIPRYDNIISGLRRMSVNHSCHNWAIFSFFRKKSGLKEPNLWCCSAQDGSWSGESGAIFTETDFFKSVAPQVYSFKVREGKEHLKLAIFKEAGASSVLATLAPQRTKWKRPLVKKKGGVDQRQGWAFASSYFITQWPNVHSF